MSATPEHFDAHQEWTERCREQAKAAEALQPAITKIQLAIGDLLIEGEDSPWSHDVYPEAAAIFTKYTVVTLRDFVYVVRRVKTSSRNDVSSFAHLKAVARFKDQPELQKELLARAAQDKMSVTTLRRTIREEHPPEKSKPGKPPASIKLSLPPELMEFVVRYAKKYKVTPDRAIFSMIEQFHEQFSEEEHDAEPEVEGVAS